jgi:hypothetical protein
MEPNGSRPHAAGAAGGPFVGARHPVGIDKSIANRHAVLP